MQRTERPDYKECVSLITTAALHEMVRPGLLAVCVPILTGLGFKALGNLSFVNDHLLGPKAVHDVRLCARDGAFAFARVRSLDCRGEAPPEEAVLELAEAVPF